MGFQTVASPARTKTVMDRPPEQGLEPRGLSVLIVIHDLLLAAVSQYLQLLWGEGLTLATNARFQSVSAPRGCTCATKSYER